MKVAGIIAEYNPFHSGHAFLAESARRAGATHVIAVMSGNFVQRGEPSLLHHSVRTRAALEGGIDLVLQLPSVYAVSSAQSFARAGVEILNATGCTDWLVFGSESGETDKISEAARLVYSDEIKPLIAAELEKGISFAVARENALRSLNSECADIIQSPNNILGVEYVAALNILKSKIEPVTFKRIGAEHDSAKAAEKIASASLIREMIKSGKDIKKYVPEGAPELYLNSTFADIKKIETAILYKMRTATAEELALAPDISEGIENRILTVAKDAKSLDELYSMAKTKRYSHARIRRIILNHFLCVTARDLACPVPYIRVTGFNQRGAELIRAFKETAMLPVITKAADAGNLSEEGKRIFSLECTAGDIYSLCTCENLPCGEEKAYRPVIV